MTFTKVNFKKPPFISFYLEKERRKNVPKQTYVEKGNMEVRFEGSRTFLSQ